MAFVIGLSGGSASGKTTVAGEVIQSLRVPWVSLLSMDSFYKVLTPEQHHRANENNYDFDVPGTWGDFMWGEGEFEFERVGQARADLLSMINVALGFPLLNRLRFQYTHVQQS